ncbi:serine protease [Caulobacter sp. 17J65-9]|uniref:trypsin-like peptidase domain-containing protein n=1 Tax=Caulobacter sp. 17J65-9 TaxID=2709382 RepID=UPI0013CC26C2|nr:trypsin-like peptidase domain-containing protein [Caulobacter sp. 17J65-9]
MDLTVELINATVQIEQVRADGERTTGTGFLIRAPKPDGTPRVVLVTAAHVLTEMTDPQASIGWRFADAGGGWRFAPAPLKIRDGSLPLWTRHPIRDVAAMEIKAPPEFAKAAIPLAWLAAETTFEDTQVGPGEEMMGLGFPRGLSSNMAGFPILRYGRVASYPVSPSAAFPTFLVDFTVFPGNSGGPVFMVDAARRAEGDATRGPFVAGLVTSMVTHDQNRESLEIGVVTHASYIRETVAMLDQPVPVAAPPPTVTAGAPSRSPPSPQPVRR